MNKTTTLLDQNGGPANLDDLASRLFHIANVLDVLSRALPEDKQRAIPARCLSASLAQMTEALAIEVSEYYFDEGVNHG